MRWPVIIAVVFLVSGCGSRPPERDSVLPYLARFKACAAKDGGILPISPDSVIAHFGAVSVHSEDSNAECDDSGLAPRLTLNISYWNTADDERREVLVFRALGHCLLSRPFSSAGIMNPHPDAYFYLNYPNQRDSYLSQLFVGF